MKVTSKLSQVFSEVNVVDAINDLQDIVENSGGVTLPIAISDVTDLQSGLDAKLAGAISRTFAQLQSDISGSLLIIGQSYLITNYETRHQIDGTGNLNDNNVVEPLFIIASANNDIFRQVYSPSNPFDTIFWDYTDVLCEDGVTARTGKITRRIDMVNNIDTYWDFRIVQVERSDVKYLSIPIDAKNIIVGKSLVGGYTYNDLKLGLGCYSNTFGDDCYSSTLGNGCYSNTFGNNCYSSTFGDDCYSNNFGNNCNSNTFGNNCSSSTFGNDCNSNTFGNNCNSNIFGDDCGLNIFGDDCNSNTFGNLILNKNFTGVLPNNLVVVLKTTSLQMFSTQANVENKVYNMLSPDGSLWANTITNAGVTTTVKLT
jgi:hypothetical protein